MRDNHAIAPRPAAGRPARLGQHDDLQRRPDPEHEVVGRQRQPAVEQQQAGLVEHVRHVQPDVHQRSDARPTRSRCCAGWSSTRRGSSCEITQINREISEEQLRATVTQTLANVRNAYWDLVFSRNADRRRPARAAARRQARRGQPRPRRSRHARAARHRPGRGGSRDSAAGARPRRSDHADRGARAQALYRERHRRSAVASGAAADRSAVARTGPDRHRGRRPPRPRAPDRPGHGAQEPPELRRLAALLPQQHAA